MLGGGGAVVVGVDLFDVTGRLGLGLILLGAALLFAGTVAHDLLAARRCAGEDRTDEYRSGHFAFVVLGGLLVTALVVVTATGVAVQAELLLVAATVVGLTTFSGARLYLGRWA